MEGYQIVGEQQTPRVYSECGQCRVFSCTALRWFSNSTIIHGNTNTFAHRAK